MSLKTLTDCYSAADGAAGCDLVDDVGDCCSLKASSSLSSRQISEETRLSAAAPPHLSSSSSSCCSSAVAPPAVTPSPCSSSSSSSTSSSSCSAQQAACPSQGNHVCIRLCRAGGRWGSVCFNFCCEAAARQTSMFLCSLATPKYGSCLCMMSQQASDSFHYGLICQLFSQKIVKNTPENYSEPNLQLLCFVRQSKHLFYNYIKQKKAAKPKTNSIIAIVVLIIFFNFLKLKY